MSKATRISEMAKIHFGSAVFCSDGEDGILADVVFDSATRRMTHIGVKQGRVFGKTVHLPFESMINATGNGVTLKVKRAEVAEAPSSVEGILLDNKSVVTGPGRGTLKLVAVQPESGELAYIVAHNLRAGQDTMVQAKYVAEIAKDHISISLSTDVLSVLSLYRSDAELQQEVEAILFDIASMHVDLKGMSIRVLDSVLYLDGNISSSLRADIARDQVYGVPGLLEIKSTLIGDDQLAADLAQALGQDPRTRDLPIGVYPRLGVVRLSGAVHNAQQKAAAEEIARKFSGVRSVINDLIVDPNEDMLHVMSAPEGGEAEDIVPGRYTRHTQ
ncbi:MAG TPA: BON domain-containing protein [Ktedonobacteraceae bacterium]|nr:BON domain-containing protein [Ktedonobacteraceae bacterium]